MVSIRNTLADQPTWGEHDFTIVPLDLRNQTSTRKSFDSQATMSTVDYSSVMDDRPEQPPYSTPGMYQTVPFTFSDLQEMGSNPTASDYTSPATSRSHSYSVSEEVQFGQSRPPLQSEKICPLMTHQTLHCTPELCGPNAACLDFSDLPDLEDCGLLPCITENLPDTANYTQTSQSQPISISETVPSKKTTANSRQRVSRAKSDDKTSRSNSKKAHSLVERRYRENLNGNITQLRLALLKTKRVGFTAPQAEDEDEESQKQSLSKVRKGDVMLEAVDYVNQTEVEIRHMADEIQLLTARVQQLERLVKCEDCALMKQFVSFRL